MPNTNFVANEQKALEFIEDIKTEELRTAYTENLFGVVITQFPFARQKFSALETLSGADHIGLCILIEMLYHYLLSRFIGVSMVEARTSGGEYCQNFLRDVNNLKPIVDKILRWTSNLYVR